MATILAIILFFNVSFSDTTNKEEQDSLPPSCDCPIPTDKVRPINMDTLEYLHDKKEYRKGLNLTLFFLNNKDTTNPDLYAYLGEFSHKYAESYMRNLSRQKKRSKSKNPHSKYGAIRDTSGFWVYRFKRKAGPRYWRRDLSMNVGPLITCSANCLLDINPANVGIYEIYLSSLISMRKFDKLYEEVKKQRLPGTPPKYRSYGAFLMQFAGHFIAHRDYEGGLKYAQKVLKHYDLRLSEEDKWNKIFHYAIRNDPDKTFTNRERALLHEKVEKILESRVE